MMSALSAVVLVALGIVDFGSLRELVGRLMPIFVFVIAISVVVNVSSQVGLFEQVVSKMEMLAPKHKRLRPVILWLLLIILAVVVTVFLSLDTTAVMITALAIPLARRNRIPVIGVAFAVVWIANVASLPLPVSNLTNLLALGSKAFSGNLDFLSYSWKPALLAIVLVIAAAALITLYQVQVGSPEQQQQSRRVQESKISQRRNPLLATCAVVVAVLMPILTTPIPYWLSTSIAAVIVLMACLPRHKEFVSIDLVPWNSLLLVTSISAAAALIHTTGVAGWLSGLSPENPDSYVELVALAGAGGLAANLMNNIPAFLFLEPLVSAPASYIALLIGVNAAPIITPWASLATLLWHDQLRRAGVHVSWKSFILLGFILAPVVVLLPTAMLL